MHHQKNLLSGWVVIPLLLCLLMTLNPIVVVGSTTVGLPVADFSGVPDFLQLFCTGAMTAAKSTTSVPFVSSLVSTSSGNSIYSVFANNGYAAMLGPVGTMLLLSMYAGTAMSSGKLVAFSPLVQDFDTSSTNDYTTNTNVPQVYFTLPRDVFQTAALLLHFTGMEQLPSSILYLACNDQTYKISMGTWDYFSTIAGYAGAAGSGINLGSSFSQSSYTSTVQSGKSTFILYTTVISNSAFSTATEQYISATVSDSVVISRNTTVSFTFPTGYLAWSQYRNAGSTKLPPSNIVTTAPVPGIESTEYTSSQAFAALQEANFASVSGNNDLNYVMTGWMSAMTLIQALTMLSTNNFNSNGAMDNFYNNIGAAQSTFLVYDMVTGPMGTTCPTMAITQGVSCCQTAARSAFLFEMKQMSGSYDWSLMNEVYIYPRGQCASVAYNSWSIWSSAAIPTPYHLFGQAPTDNDMMTYMCGQVQAVTRVMSNQTLYGLVSSHSYRMYCQTTTISNIATDLSSFEEYFRVDTLGGAVADALVGSKTTGFTLDFIPQTTQPALTASNLFYLFPTLEQELYQMAVYLYTLPTPPTKVCGVIQTSTSSTAIKTLLTNTLSTFLLPFSASNVVVVTSGTLAGSIPSECTDTFVIGIEDGDVAALVSYLQEQSSSSVYISFDDLAKYYDQFQSQSSLQQASGLTSRLVFATNLPSWTATPSASSSSTMSGLTTYEEFLQSVDTSLHTPAALRTFFAVSMFGYIASENSPTLPNLQTTMYSKSILSIGGLVFGPFLSSGATFSGESSSTAKNYGAQDIGVWSYSRVVDPTTPLLMAPSTPSLSYTSTGSSALSEFVPVHEMIAYATATSQNCVDAEESSSGTTEGPTTTTTTTTTEAPQTTTPAPRESSTRSSSDTSKDETMNVLMVVLAIIAAIAWMAVLVIWLGQRFPCAVPSWTWFEGDPLSRVRSVCGRNTSGETNLRERSSDVARAPQQGIVCTLTVVDMPDAWQRWASAPVSMRRDNARFVKIVRQATVDHQCYEVRVVCGTFVIACPSSSDAIALVRTLTHRGIDAKTTEVRMAVHTLNCTSSHVTQEHGWWCGDEAARIVLCLCGLGETGQVLVTKATLDALGDQSETTAMGAIPCKNLRVSPKGHLELFSLPVLAHKTSCVTKYIGRWSSDLMIESVLLDRACHPDYARSAVSDVMNYHYELLGADIRPLDQTRMCSDFAPGVGASEDQRRLLCIDRVAAVMVWKHNDIAWWGNVSLPSITINETAILPPTPEVHVASQAECFSPLSQSTLGGSQRPRGIYEGHSPRHRYRRQSTVLRQFSYGNDNSGESPRKKTVSMSDVWV